MHHCVVVRGNDSACIRVWGGHHRVLYAWNNKLNAPDANKDDGNDKVEDRNIFNELPYNIYFDNSLSICCSFRCELNISIKIHF